MFTGRWIVAVAFGLALASSLQAQQEAGSGSDRAENNQEITRDLAGEISVRIIEDDESAQSRERRENEAADREKDDLIAQQGMNTATQAMNDATQRMAYYSLISTVLVGIGTALLTYTLILTRQANRAAQAAVEVTRAVGRAQTRAYVFFNMEGIENSFEIDIRNPSEISVDFEIVNTGQTPAQNLRHIARIVIRNRSEKFEGEVIKVMEGQQVPDASLKPSGTVNATADSFGPFIESDFRDCFLPEGNKRIFLIGRIFYDDVFDEPHETKFCFYLEPIDRIRDDKFEIGLSRWEQYAQHNSAN